MNKDSGLETPPTSDAVERHYWKAVTFLVILILVGSGFWGVRRFAPAVFLGKPDLIAVPNEEHSQSQTTETLAPSTPELLNINTASAEELETLPNIGANGTEDCRLSRAIRQVCQCKCPSERQGYRGKGAGEIETFR